MKNGYKLFLLSLACVNTVALFAAEQESGKPGRPQSPIIDYNCYEDFNKICRGSLTHQAPDSDNNDDNLPTYAQYAAAYSDPNFYDDEGLTPLALPSPAAPPACPPTSSSSSIAATIAFTKATRSYRARKKIITAEDSEDDDEAPPKKPKKINKPRTPKKIDSKKICPTCNKPYKALFDHLLTHSEPAYKCSACIKTTRKPQNIISHFIRRHMTDSLCKICNKTIETDTTPREHARLCHIDTRKKRKERDKKTNSSLNAATAARSATPASSSAPEAAAASQSAPKKARKSKD